MNLSRYAPICTKGQLQYRRRVPEQEGEKSASCCGKVPVVLGETSLYMSANDGLPATAQSDLRRGVPVTDG